MTYPGGKNGHGTYQTIINQIPPHHVYVEPFAGSAAIYRNIKRANLSYLIDVDYDAAMALLPLYDPGQGTTVDHKCGLQFLEEYTQGLKTKTFIYCDPPYVMESRRSQRPIYTHEWDRADHIKFLNLIKSLRCSIAVSGYSSELYFEELAGWRHVSFTAQTRHGPATEYLWMNYPEPTALHDYRYLGGNARERERIKRRRKRWAANFAGMSSLERQAVLLSMIEAAPGSLIAITDGDGVDLRQIRRQDHAAINGDVLRKMSPDTAATASTALCGDDTGDIAAYGEHRVTTDTATPADSSPPIYNDPEWARGQHG